MTYPVELHSHVRDLLDSPATGNDLQLCPLPGGRNNRVYRADSGGKSYFVKHYYRDSRDRLQAEFGFSTFLSRFGVRSMPAPVAADPDHGLALYEFVRGRRLSAGEVTPERVETAMAFFARINCLRHEPKAVAIPAAAEACFSLSEHMRTIEARVQRVCAMVCHDTLDQEVQRWAADKLQEVWQGVAATASEQSARQPPAISASLVPEHRCLSPSDFGFHNAILNEAGELIFHDFEYAGWDDTAKFVADFFSQTELPVPQETFASCVDRVIGELGLPDWHRDRIEVIVPLYRVKWCCIVLNDFLDGDGQRRRFASSALSDVRQQQFDLARQLADACGVQGSI